jgi:hypothetical protein
VCKLESSTEASGSGQDKEGLRDESLANDGAMQNMEKCLEKVTVEQYKA